MKNHRPKNPMPWQTRRSTQKDHICEFWNMHEHATYQQKILSLALFSLDSPKKTGGVWSKFLPGRRTLGVHKSCRMRPKKRERRAATKLVVNRNTKLLPNFFCISKRVPGWVKKKIILKIEKHEKHQKTQLLAQKNCRESGPSIACVISVLDQNNHCFRWIVAYGVAALFGPTGCEKSWEPPCFIFF